MVCWISFLSFYNSFYNHLLKLKYKVLPASCVGTALDNIVRIIGRDISPNIPRTIDKYICQDNHVKACTKALPKDDIIDTIAITVSGNPKSFKVLHKFLINYCNNNDKYVKVLLK